MSPSAYLRPSTAAEEAPRTWRSFAAIGLAIGSGTLSAIAGASGLVLVAIGVGLPLILALAPLGAAGYYGWTTFGLFTRRPLAARLALPVGLVCALVSGALGAYAYSVIGDYLEDIGVAAWLFLAASFAAAATGVVAAFVTRAAREELGDPFG